jgi:hypothetical protein
VIYRKLASAIQVACKRCGSSPPARLRCCSANFVIVADVHRYLPIHGRLDPLAISVIHEGGDRRPVLPGLRQPVLDVVGEDKGVGANRARDHVAVGVVLEPVAGDSANSVDVQCIGVHQRPARLRRQVAGEVVQVRILPVVAVDSAAGLRRLQPVERVVAEALRLGETRLVVVDSRSLPTWPTIALV